MALIDGILQELEHEAQTTRRVLKNIPDDKLSWRPGAKARTLGELAHHVASTPAGVAQLASLPSPAQIPDFAAMESTPARAADLIPLLDKSLAQARQALSGMDDASLTAPWRLMRGDHELLTLSRAAFLRSILLNHWYHHRGQLTVYLRGIGAPVPSVYGPSADENPFA